MLKIEKGVPVPKARRSRRASHSSWPLVHMVTGDSFVVPDMSQARVWSRANAAANFRIQTRQEANGVRVWRVRPVEADALAEAMELLAVAILPDMETGARLNRLRAHIVREGFL